MAFENRRRGGGIEKKEKREEIEKRNVARFFLLQSMSAGELEQKRDAYKFAENSFKDEKEEIKKIEFTKVFFMLKGEASEQRGFLIPLGGKIQEGEDPQKAALREVVEEAHVRPSAQSIKKCDAKTVHEYEHRSEKRKDTTTYFIGRLLPEEILFPLNEKDHIESFMGLSREELKTLLEKGEIEKDEKKIPLIDSLTNRENEGIALVHQELEFHMLGIEAEKKLDVAEKLILQRLREMPSKRKTHTFNHYNQLLEKKRMHFDALQQIKSSQDSAALTTWFKKELLPFWQEEIVEGLDIVFGNLHDALQTSNTEARLRYAQEDGGNFENGIGIPSVMLFLPTVMQRMRKKEAGEEKGKAQYLSDGEEDAMRDNPNVHIIQKLFDTIDSSISNNTSTPKDEELLQKLQKEKIPFAEYLTPEKIEKYSKIIDDYFEKLFREAGVANEKPIRQQKAVSTAALPKEQILATLHQLATGSDQLMPEKPHDETTLTQWQYEQQVRWEAARKMMLVLLLGLTEDIYNEKKEDGIAHIDAVEKEVTKNIESLQVIKTREKTLLSAFRKMIVRDTTSRAMKDMYAGTFLCENENDIEIIRKAVPDGIEIEDAKKQKVTTISAPASIHEYIAGLAQKNTEATTGDKIKIIAWKEPTSDGKIESSGPGGGGDIRMWKWYVEHTDNQKKKRFKEIQAYAPQRKDDGSLHAATAQFEEKKEDDKRYGISRLFKAKSVRSFMELLFPAHVYSDEARQMYIDTV